MSRKLHLGGPYRCRLIRRSGPRSSRSRRWCSSARSNGGGGHDLAPKHMAMPLGWGGWFAFACSPTHATQSNAQRTGAFTVSFRVPTGADRLDQPRRLAPGRGRAEAGAGGDRDGARNHVVEGVLVEGAYLWLECELDRVIEGYGENSLITGELTASAADEARPSRRRRRRRAARRVAAACLRSPPPLRRDRADPLLSVPGRLPRFDAGDEGTPGLAAQPQPQMLELLRELAAAESPSREPASQRQVRGCSAPRARRARLHGRGRPVPGRHHVGPHLLAHRGAAPNQLPSDTSTPSGRSGRWPRCR